MLKGKKNKVKQNKSVEVKVKVPVTSTSFMSLILIGLITLVGYSGYLGVSSVWKFTHPKFNISLDAFKSLGYIAKGVTVPPIAGPTYSGGTAPQESQVQTYLQSVAVFKSEFRADFPNSKLLGISDNEVLNIGWSFCEEKQKAIDANGEFSKTEIITAYQSKFVLKYPGIKGLSDYLDGIAQRAFDNLCGGM